MRAVFYDSSSKSKIVSASCKMGILVESEYHHACTRVESEFLDFAVLLILERWLHRCGGVLPVCCVKLTRLAYREYLSLYDLSSKSKIVSAS